MKKIFSFLFLSLITVYANAQVAVSSGASAATLAATLAGPGITVSAATLNCPGSAEGTFTGVSTLGFTNGIVLTNGRASAAFGPESPTTTISGGVAGDPQLNALAGVATLDGCILEFDFIPLTSSMSISYAFGSEEYRMYTCSPFNDAFGMFLTGPGYTNFNIAKVPGTTVPVCINSINCGATGTWSTATCTALGSGSPFCARYFNNLGGPTVAYPGVSVTLQATADVTPCANYHLKIAIADATDDILDAGVFLKANSLIGSAASAGTISGSLTICAGHTTSLSTSGTAGGTWGSLNTWVATVNSTGVVTGLHAGTATITYSVGTPCGTLSTSAVVTVNEAPVVGTLPPRKLCVGDDFPLSFIGTTTPGGTWHSFNTGVATVTSSGLLHGAGAGTALITYTVTNPPCPPATASIIVTVNALPTAYIVETTGHHCEGDVLIFCVHGPSNMSFAYDGSPTDGVAWPYPGSSYTGTADASGVFCFTVTAVAPMTSFHLVTITDPLTGCSNFIDLTKSVCVAPVPTAGPITGPDYICQTTTESYTAAFTGVPGGFWSLSNTHASLVYPSSASTDVLGVSPGTVTLSFAVTNCCASAVATKDIDIRIMPTASATYVGCTPPCPGSTLAYLISGTAGATVYYNWIDPGTGMGAGAYVTLDAMGYATVSIPTSLTPGFFHFLIMSISLNDCINHDGTEANMLDLEWPTAFFDESPLPPCDGGCVYLHISGTPGATTFIEPGHIPVTLDASGQWNSTGVFPCITVTGTVTFSIGTVSGLCCSHFSGSSLTVTSIPYPVVTLTSNSPVCEGDIITFTVTCTPASASYDWVFPGGLGTTTTSPTLSISPATMADAGFYTVTGYNGLCSTTAMTNVIVKPIPPMPSATYIGCTPPCPGTAMTYAISGAAGATVNYNWIDPGTGMGAGGTVFLGTSGYATVTIPTSFTPGFFHFLIMSITLDGCTNYDGIETGMEDLEWPTASFDESPVPPCEGGCVYLHIVGTPGATTFIEPGHIPVTIDASGEWSSSSVFPCITVSGTTTFTIGTVTGPCCAHYSGSSITVTAVPYPVVTITAPIPLCEGSPLVLTATSIPGPSLHYDWVTPSTSISTSVPTYTETGWATPADDGVYSVTGWNGECATTATTTVTVIPSPTATMWFEYDCSQNQPMYILHFSGTASSTVYYSPLGYSGPLSHILLDAAGTGTVSAVYTGTITFIIAYVISPEGCSSMVSYPGCTVTAPVPVITCWKYQDAGGLWHLGFTSSVTPMNLIFHADVSNGTSNCYSISYPTGVIVVPGSGGTGSVEVLPCSLVYTPCTFGCTTAHITSITTTTAYNSAECVWQTGCTTSINGTSDGAGSADRPAGSAEDQPGQLSAGDANSSLEVIPNPNTGTFTLLGTTPVKATSQEVRVEMLDILGKAVFTDVIQVENGHLSKKFTLSDNIANGIYLVKIKSEGGNQVVRFTLDR